MTNSNTREEREFFQVLANGDLDRLRLIVGKNKSLLDSYDYGNFGATPLTMACFGNRRSVVETLLHLGADPNRKSDWHMGPWSPLHCAIYRHDKELAEYLLNHGATLDTHAAAGLGDKQALTLFLNSDPNRVFERGGDGCYPLHFADSVGVAEILLERGADIDGRCIDHYSTPVQYLCSVRPEVARFLFSKGATPDIFSAVLSGDDALIERMLNDQPELIESRINQQFLPPGNGHDVHNILTFSLGQDATPLHAAARANRREGVSTLIRQGMSPDVRGGYDQATPLHLAAWHNCVHSAQALLDCGAEIDVKSGNIHNNSPAGWAIVAGAWDVFELLVNCGATRFPWFIDDARDACNGRFDQISQSSLERRQRILNRLSD